MVAELNSELPEFKESMVEIVQSCGWQNVVIKQIKMDSEPSKKGDSYLSTIMKFSIEATGLKNTKEENIVLPVIMKVVPKNIARRKTFRSEDFFETEINFYTNVWPIMKKLKDSRNIKEEYEVPLVLSSNFEGANSYIALQNLSFDGYGTIELGQGIDHNYASLFLKLLARFHALSIAARGQDPTFKQVAMTLKETYFDEKFRKWYTGFQLNKLYKVIRNAVQRELDDYYLEKIDNLFANDYYGLLIKATKVDNKLSVVTEGDAWLPNFLVRHEHGKPVNAVLIDFQLARYSTLTNDLLHFAFSCISHEVLADHWDDLIEEYHKYLSQRIFDLGSDRNLITLEELKQDIQENSLLGMAMAIESMVMAMLKDDEIPDLDMNQGDQEVPLETVWDISPFTDDRRNKIVASLMKLGVDKNLIK